MPENVSDFVSVELVSATPDVELPVARIHDGVPVCPACGARDELREVDIAIRLNPMEATGPDSVVVSLEDSNFEHLGFACLVCCTYVSLPAEVDYS